MNLPLLELDPHQVLGAAWLASKTQALCSDFMGIGKARRQCVPVIS